MASDREIENFRKDPDKWRLLITQLLTFDREALSEEFLDFAERMERLAWLDEVSYRQAEWLLGVRDNLVTVSQHRGFNLRALIKTLFYCRADLAEADEEWVETMYLSDMDSFRRREARRIYALAHEIGEVDHEDAA